MHQRQTMYNLTVAEARTFFVGTDHWLVHNTCWTPNPRRNLSPVQNAYKHWLDHRMDFPQLHNAKQYVEVAHDFVNHPPPTALTKTRANGDLVIYDPISDIFAVRASTGAPRTMYIPDPAVHGYLTNLDYFYAQ